MIELTTSFWYPDPVPGFIATAVVTGGFILWAVIVALANFGPFTRKKQ